MLSVVLFIRVAVHFTLEDMCRRSTRREEEHIMNTKPHAFDDRNIRWFKLAKQGVLFEEGASGDFEHLMIWILDVDVSQKIVDFLVKYEANQQIFLHRHLALTNTLTIQGEHRLYEPNGALKEVRPVGRYTSSPPGEPHREGAGDEESVVFYSVRGKDGILFEVLDDDLNVVGTLGMEAFIGALKEQQNA
jgi:hypothetical protein